MEQNLPAPLMGYTQRDILKKITALLETHHIPYMLTGAWSVIYYGRPRASHDIDIVVEIKPEKLETVILLFSSLDTDFTVQPEMIRQAVAGGQKFFQVVYLPTLVKIDFWLLQNDAFDQARFVRRQTVTILNQRMTTPTAEDTILKKLLWYRQAKLEKHLVDAAFVHQIQKNNLDRNYLTKWAKKLKVEKLLKEVSTLDLEPYM